MKFRTWVIALAILIVLLIVWSKLRYHPSEFKGGVSMRDSGSWVYPHYRAELAPVPLNVAGDHEYALSGLPSESFSLNLLVDSHQDETRRAAANLRTRLQVVLTDNAGNTLCSADGPIAGGGNMWDSTWIVASSATSAYLWSPKCRQMDTSRNKRYQMKIHVDDVDPSSPRVDLIPILRGGGNELP
jgi:hypothetical protein